MTSVPPAEIGTKLEDVETPALLVDLDAFERNLLRMQRATAGLTAKLRPHAKTHRSPIIALKQMALGAVGVCCQKVAEAEALVQGGVPDVLVSNQIVGKAKCARLAALAKQARVAVCADDPLQIEGYAEAARAYGVKLKVLVEINVGADRCGVEPGESAVRLAQQIAASPHLQFGGLQAYHGRAQHKRSYAERAQSIAEAIDKTRLTVEALKRAGLGCEIVGGAGTGTFEIEGASAVYNELQAGSYVFMDADYARNLAPDGKPIADFEHSLFVYATVMSKPVPERAVVDAGLKAYSTDTGFPVVQGVAGVEVVRASDEHGLILLHDTKAPIRLGQKLKLIPGHCDPTVNLHDWYVGYRKDRVEAIWPVAGRGAGL